MRALMIVAIVILILVAVGWLRFFSPDGNPTVQIDTDRVQQDTAEFVEESKRAMDGAADAIERRRDSSSNVPLAPRTPVDANDTVVPVQP